MPAGRPTSYQPEFIEKVKEYLAIRQDEEVKTVKQSNIEKGYEMYETKVKVNLPTIEGLAKFLGVDKSSLYEWAEKYPEFSHALENVRIEQHDRLIDKGLSGDYNSTIAKLVLSSNHNYREKTEEERKHSGEIKINTQNYAQSTDIPSPPISVESI